MYEEKRRIIKVIEEDDDEAGKVEAEVEMEENQGGI